MKKDLHPPYFTDTKVTCACGNSFVTGSTVESIQVEICSNCHPFFTGKSKLIDTAGRVDKFKARLKQAEVHKADKTAKPQAKGQIVDVKTEQPASDTEVIKEAELTEQPEIEKQEEQSNEE